MIDVISADNPPGKLLQQIVFFIGALCRSQESDAVRAVLFFSGLKLGSNQAKGLLPACPFQLPVFTNKRVGQAVSVVDIVKPKAAFNAELAFVDTFVAGSGNFNNLIVFDVKPQRTANAAITAYSINLLKLPLSSLAQLG